VDTAKLFPRMVTAEEVSSLESLCTKEEILEVIKGFTKEKKPKTRWLGRGTFPPFL